MPYWKLQYSDINIYTLITEPLFSVLLRNLAKTFGITLQHFSTILHRFIYFIALSSVFFQILSMSGVLNL